MTSFPDVNGRYKYNYIGDDHTRTLQEIEDHHILVQKSTGTSCILYISILSLIANTCYLLFSKDKTGALVCLMIFLIVIFVKYWKSIEKESVVIMPGLGVQLETHFKSGRVVHRFVPIEHMLKPVLKECLTPVTCYWSLGLIVHGEAKLMLVFQELRPPVNMLVLVWKALCSATEPLKEVTDTVTEDDHL